MVGRLGGPPESRRAHPGLDALERWQSSAIYCRDGFGPRLVHGLTRRPARSVVRHESGQQWHSPAVDAMISQLRGLDALASLHASLGSARSAPDMAETHQVECAPEQRRPRRRSPRLRGQSHYRCWTDSASAPQRAQVVSWQ
eukprot:1651378-Pyramimonas_sp.AAC.1